MKELFSVVGRLLGPEDDSNRISVDELKAIINSKADLMLIDVRTDDEYREGHIPGSKSIPLHLLEKAALPESPRIILYCTAGVRSVRARKIFASRRVKGVVDLKGGINAWAASGGRVIRDQIHKEG